MDASKEYFKYAKDKVYIKQYPKDILELDFLVGKRILDIGAGNGNDLAFMYDFGLDSSCLFYLDSNPESHAYAKRKLTRNGFPEENIILADAAKTGLEDSSFDIIYANNMIHCLGNLDNMQGFFRESYRILSKDGIIVGRTLFNEIYMDLAERRGPNDFHRYTAHLMEIGELIGLEPSNLESLTKQAGFSNFRYDLEEMSSNPVRNFYFRAEKR